MKPKSTSDISQLLRGYLPAAAVGTALELGLFWELEKTPKSSAEIAESFSIPSKRCQYWLEYLLELGLLGKKTQGYYPSQTARDAILKSRSQETWAFLAGESRERLPAVQDMAIHIREQGSVWDSLGLTPPDYLAKLENDPDNAQRFTRMLYELHQGEAELLSELLDMKGVARLLDVGGGSGVMSLALLSRHTDLTAVVLDQANVCSVGRQIAKENGMEARITYQEANFLQEDIPTGFDLVMECDVGIYNETLFRKIHNALNPGGRFVILDYQFETEAASRLNLMGRAFFNSLENPNFEFETIEDLKAMLKGAGFRSFSEVYPIESGLFFESWK